MDVEVDGDLIRSERERRAWSQEHLAGAAGIGVRTVQRIEATGVASYESLRAISAAFEMPVGKLRVDASLRQTSGAREEHSMPRQELAWSSRIGGSPAVLGLALRWLGAALGLVMLAGMSSFLLLHDYKKVRVLRTVENWVTQAQPSAGAATRSDGR